MGRRRRRLERKRLEKKRQMKRQMMKMIRERKEVKKMVEKKAKKVKMTKIRLLSNVVLVERKIGLISIFVGSVELVWREEKRRVVVFLVLGLGLIQSCTLIMGLDLMIVTILIWTSRGTNGPIGDREPDRWQKGNHSQGMNWKSMIFISQECFSILTLFSKARIITMIPLSLVFVITWPLKLCVGWKQSSNLTVSPQPIFEFIRIKLLLIGQKVPFKSRRGFELKAWTQSTVFRDEFLIEKILLFKGISKYEEETNNRSFLFHILKPPCFLQKTWLQKKKKGNHSSPTFWNLFWFFWRSKANSSFKPQKEQTFWKNHFLTKNNQTLSICQFGQGFRWRRCGLLY